MTPDNDFREFWNTYQRLLGLITDPDGKRYSATRTLNERRAEMELQIPRLARFLAFAKWDSSAYKTVHIAGTSGKGSVTAIVARILHAAGIPAGHHISPYFQVPNEKLVFSGKPIAPSRFVELVTHFFSLHDNWIASGESPLKYGEAWVALTLFYFEISTVEWAIVETGMGGRFDPTNVISSDLAIITNISLDHTESLGSSIEEIAWHKAGIIKQGVPVITAETNPAALTVLEGEARTKGAPIYVLGREYSVEVTESNRSGMDLNIHLPGQRLGGIRTNLTGKHQAANIAMASMAIQKISENCGLEFPEDALRNGLAKVSMPGRMEIVQVDPTVILDGAHNPAKISALTGAIRDLYRGNRIIVVFGMLSNKDGSAMLEILQPIVHHWILTAPKVFGKPALEKSVLAARLNAIDKNASVSIAPNANEAIQSALQYARRDDLVVVTGSIYLVGEARSYWYPTNELLARLELESDE